MTGGLPPEGAYALDRQAMALRDQCVHLDRRSPEYVRLRRQIFDIEYRLAVYAAKAPLFFWMPAFVRLARWIFDVGHPQ